MADRILPLSAGRVIEFELQAANYGWARLIVVCGNYVTLGPVL
jgi:hypothetical protein